MQPHQKIVLSPSWFAECNAQGWHDNTTRACIVPKTCCKADHYDHGCNDAKDTVEDIKVGVRVPDSSRSH